MPSDKFTLLMNRAGFDSTDEHWREVIKEHTQTWSEAADLLKEYKLRHGNRAIAITFDWEPAVASCKRYASAMKKIDAIVMAGRPPTRSDLKAFQASRTKIPIEISASGNREYFHPALYIENRLADVFLMMNIADPGCCNFYLAKFFENGAGGARRRDMQKLSLSHVFFEFSRLRSLNGIWPPIHTVGLKDVVGWYQTIRSGCKQVPQNQIEKALFSMLHVAFSDATPTTVIWLFYCLETLFDTKTGENRAALERRISLLLEPSEKDRATLKSGLRKLYDYRSSIVHGGLSVASPLDLESLDDDFDEQYSRMVEAIEFGFIIIVASFQKLVLNGWKSVKFSERMEGSC